MVQEERLDDRIATVVVRGLDTIVAVSFVELLNLRRSRLERFRDTILLPLVGDRDADLDLDSEFELQRAAAPQAVLELDEPLEVEDVVDVEEDSEVTLLPLTGSIITPLSRLKPEFRRDTDQCWVLLDIPVESKEPVLPEHLIAIGLNPACRKGADQLVGVIDSGVDESEADKLTVRHFGVALSSGKVKVSSTPKDCHWREFPKDPAGGWFHGSQVCSRIAGEYEGVAPASQLAVAAALTGVGADTRPTGTLHQFLAALSWLATSPFRMEPAPLGCDVINASLSIGAEKQRDRDALAYTLKLVAANNILIVCAVGADENPAGVPLGPLAADPATLAVGALDEQLRFSSVNLYDTTTGKPEICAPGPTTSLATPLVTGAAALLLARQPGLRASAAKLKESLIKDFAATAVKEAPADLATGRLMLTGICPEDESVIGPLRGLPPDAVLSLTVQCRVPASEPSEANFRSYLKSLDAAFEPIKRPVVTALEGAGTIDVVDVPHTPFIVATATAERWRALLAPEGYLAEHPDLIVLDEGTVKGEGGEGT
jgi:hypothetical protein